MKRLIIIIALPLGLTGNLLATTFDLGPTGSSYTRTYNLAQLNGAAVNGQTVSFDLNFNNSVHLFQNTWPDFEIGLSFLTNGSNIGFMSGSGFVLDAAGNQMCAIRPLGSGDSASAFYLGLFPLFADKDGTLATDIVRPLDFYGVHFELTLPNDAGVTITDGQLSLRATDFVYRGMRTEPFRIGPHVPETGATILLLAIAFVLLSLGRVSIRQ